MNRKGVLYAIVTFIFLSSICLAGYFAIQYNFQRFQSTKEKADKDQSIEKLTQENKDLSENLAQCQEVQKENKQGISRPKVTFESFEVIGVPTGAIKSYYQAAQLVRQKGILDQKSPSGEDIDQWTLTVDSVNNVWQVSVRSHFATPSFACTYSFTSEDDFRAVDPCGWNND